MENYSQELAAARIAALAAIRTRVAQVAGNWLRDDECIQLVLASSTRSAKDLLEFMFNGIVARAAAMHAKSLSMTPDEWDALFGHSARPVRTTKLEGTLAQSTFLQCSSSLQSALRTTINESAQAGIWTRPWSKAACVLAMHIGDDETFISSCLGNIVRGDLRRLEDMRNELDDTGVEVMMVADVIAALSESVT